MVALWGGVWCVVRIVWFCALADHTNHTIPHNTTSRHTTTQVIQVAVKTMGRVNS
jgi:hypothetical protein